MKNKTIAATRFFYAFLQAKFQTIKMLAILLIMLAGIAIGFPITSTIGFVVLLLTLDVLAPTMQRFFEQGFDLMGITVRAWGV